MKGLPALIGLGLILASCGTPYQTIGLRGGVAAEQVTSNVFRIQARGNAYTGRSQVQDYVLLKAAETTKEAGGSHFIIGGTEDASRQTTITTPGEATTTISHRTAVTTYSPGETYNLIKPGQDTLITVIKAGPGQTPPPGALAADEIIQFVGPRVKRD